MWNLLSSSQDFPNVSHTEKDVVSKEFCRGWLRFALWGLETIIPQHQEKGRNEINKLINLKKTATKKNIHCSKRFTFYNNKNPIKTGIVSGLINLILLSFGKQKEL